MKLIEKRCEYLAHSHNKKEREAGGPRKSIKLRRFSAHLRKSQLYRPAQDHTNTLITEIEASSKVSKKFYWVRIIMVVAGTLPFIGE